MTTFAERLKGLREEHGLSQAAVGEAIGVSRYAVYTYEKGKAAPTMEGLMALADHFDVTVDYLLGRSDIRKWEQ